MRILRASMFTAVALLGAMTSDANADEQASEATVKEFIAVTGAGNLGVQVMQTMLPSLKRLVPNAPESFWTDFMHEVKPEDLETLLVPVYQKNFTEDEIRETIKFYRTPTGQKLIRQLPNVMRESMALGQMWGQQLAQKVIEKAKAQKLQTL